MGRHSNKLLTSKQNKINSIKNITWEGNDEADATQQLHIRIKVYVISFPKRLEMSILDLIRCGASFPTVPHINIATSKGRGQHDSPTRKGSHGLLM